MCAQSDNIGMKTFILLAVLAIGDILPPKQCNALPVFFNPTSQGDRDQPLMLSPLIEQGQLEQARTQSRVNGRQVGMNLESYSGFLTAGTALQEAHLFFWFFPALTNPRNAPVILWMNGGPGLSSLSGLFAEIGPYRVTEDGQFELATVTWLSKFSLIFLDAPAGTGFSLPKSTTVYTNTAQDIANDVHEVLSQFFQVFPDYLHQDFYAAGESYAAKYVITLANILKTSSSQLPPPINLKGLLLVSGLIDPVNNIKSADFLYQTGIVQEQVYEQLTQGIQSIAQLVNAGQYVQASEIIGAIIGTNYQPSFFADESGIKGSNNILRDVFRPKFSTYIPYVNGSRSVRRALHAGVDNQFVETADQVLLAFIQSGDFARSVRPQLETLLDADLKVLYATGNMDYLIVPFGAKTAVEALQWKCSDQFLNVAQRVVWRVDAADVNSAGYVKCACNFCWALVRNAGHRVPGDEPVRALDLVDRFINNKPF